MSVLYIVRGLPGSGKSTLAKKLVEDTYHKEADMYHMINGKYEFDISKIKESHEWCQQEICDIMKSKNECVVSNTFTQRWEYQPYIDMTNEFKYDVVIIHCQGPWKNIHDIPPHTLNIMKARWEHHVSD